MTVDQVIQLRCQCNNYPWGRKGEASAAARYCAQTPGTDFKIEQGKEYAEMWMGTYPVLPSYSLKTNEDLQDILDANQEQLIGGPVLKKFGSKLPYLPKILSIDKALPLQIHPDKDLAQRLHEKNPDQFTDPNHKPEIAVALGKFEVFVGWKPLNVIQALFQLKPLQRFLPEKHTHFDNNSLKSIAKTILATSDETIAQTQNELLALPKASFGTESHIPELLPRLQQQYSKQDNGNIVALCLMNYLVLNAGDSIYVPADGIHAYLSGDIVECMARSNNVLNTGFCPRPDRDSVELFSAALTFGPHSADDSILPAKPSDKSINGKSSVYAPPMSEFNMLTTQLKEGEKEDLKPINGPGIMIVTSGSGTMSTNRKDHELKEGYVFFIGQGLELSFKSEKGLATYMAYVEG
ncbi:mannose-6-phosphate isomerase [Xylona heveae TC161]|uniref:Mannose-6-phosphate isomerase n=1 Tax=Xylona heveae (strain CBS 132557 / TC161) TaxID=1328760 RepID=A0A165A4M5_XYLHT|nr:mannose-6-phosphate isomerase [Xylona heveae TC161]KZF19943.1 mannose-6-phosphate isomerase [Xylona heveae TC161]